MAITRINEFQAQPGRGHELKTFLLSFTGTIESAAGCLSCRLLQGQDDPDRIVVVEEWDSTAAHQAALANVKPEDLQAGMQLCAGPPRGAWFTG